MLDVYIRGEVERISPEATVPVFRIKTQSETLGGAVNVVKNLNAIDVNVRFISITGKDENGKKIAQLLKELPNVRACLFDSHKNVTATKTRSSLANQQLLRTDDESFIPLSPSD